MFRLGAPSDADLSELLDAARASAPSYTGDRSGLRHDEYRGNVGRDWERARDGLRAWAAHAGAGLRIDPAAAPLEVGQTVIASGAVAGPLHVIIPCRISHVVDEADRFGFTYVTLPGHPECGEETFMLSRDGEEVAFTMSSYSHPAELLARLGGPVSRLVQRRTNHAYIAGMRAFVAG
ncbi:MAG TPA: DUF1990 domain-containing protein [Acidimicrobiales bacterium]|nr:DUF1990 domain-containing protein [Acidimicrobiales bacterium]